jgi:tetratricopeptide (TPR) repeat protein
MRALRRARGNWILWLDGDEYFDETSRFKLRGLLSHLNDEKTAFMMGQHSRSHEGLGLLVHQVRLFRNDPEIRWEYRVHEQVLPALQRAGHQVHRTDILISHTGYQDHAKQAGKMQRNLRLLLLDLADRPDDPFTLFNLGLAYSKLRAHDAAVDPLLRSLKMLAPDSHLRPKATAALVRAYDRLGRSEEAWTTCSAARTRFPENLELLGLDGSLRLARGDEAGAERCWKEVLWSRTTPPIGYPAFFQSEEEESMPPVFGETGEPRDVDEAVFPCAGHNLAMLYRRQGRAADAEAQWRDVLEGYPGFLLGWVALGEFYRDQGCWTDLERTAQAMERESRMIPEALALRAQGLLACQDFAQAQDLLRLALARDPSFLKAKEILSHVLLQEAKEPAAAEALLREILQSDPANAQAWHNLVVLYHEQNRMVEATDLCQEALVQCPNDPDLLLLHGMLLQEQGESGKAEACLLAHLRTPPPSAETRRQSFLARHYLAVTYRDRGRLAEAVAQWQNLLADAPEELPAWVGLAEVYLSRGDVDACDEIAKRLSWRPEWRLEAKVLQARVDLAQKDYSAARLLLEEVLVDHPHDERSLVLLSQALLQEGDDWIAAEQVLRKILQVNPQNREAQHNLDVLLERLDRSPVSV